jgi:hypothetical protein
MYAKDKVKYDLELGIKSFANMYVTTSKPSQGYLLTSVKNRNLQAKALIVTIHFFTKSL